MKKLLYSVVIAGTMFTQINAMESGAVGQSSQEQDLMEQLQQEVRELREEIAQLRAERVQVPTIKALEKLPENLQKIVDDWIYSYKTYSSYNLSWVQFWLEIVEKPLRLETGELYIPSLRTLKNQGFVTIEDEDALHAARCTRRAHAECIAEYVKKVYIVALMSHDDRDSDGEKEEEG